MEKKFSKKNFSKKISEKNFEIFFLKNFLENFFKKTQIFHQNTQNTSPLHKQRHKSDATCELVK